MIEVDNNITAAVNVNKTGNCCCFYTNALTPRYILVSSQLENVLKHCVIELSCEYCTLHATNTHFALFNAQKELKVNKTTISL